MVIYTGGKTTPCDPKSQVHLYYCISQVEKICFGGHNTTYFYTNLTERVYMYVELHHTDLVRS